MGFSLVFFEDMFFLLKLKVEIKYLNDQVKIQILARDFFGSKNKLVKKC